jgi:nucleoside-diphosphate-sugar epimerase
VFIFEGTKNVIDACVELKVKRLVYTSSPSVVFDGIHGIHNGSESLPYPPSVPTLPTLRFNFHFFDLD